MALYKESHKIKVFEPNEITLNAVPVSYTHLRAHET